MRTDSTTYAIKRAYKDISLKYHPDKNPDDKKAGEKFIKYQAAYEVLKDASKRDAYNKFGAAGLDDGHARATLVAWRDHPDPDLAQLVEAALHDLQDVAPPAPPPAPAWAPEPEAARVP